MDSEPIAGDATLFRLNALCERYLTGSSSRSVVEKLLLLFQNPYLNPISNEAPNSWGEGAKNAIERFRRLNSVDVVLRDLTSLPDEGSQTLTLLNQLSPYPRTNFLLEEK